MINMVQLLKTAVSQQASDLHILTESPPILRIHGSITRIDHPPLKEQDTKNLCFSVITDAQKAVFEQDKALDFSFGLGKDYRFRGHLFFQKGAVSGSFRLIPSDIPSIESLGLPPSILRLSQYPYGVVLITGPTGSGKSTTLATLIKQINYERRSHIITIEDPIEYIHEHNNCIITQKELGHDICSFGNGLKAALREDPDVCLVGEMRDKETIANVLHTAETGHLVLSTLHTNTAFDSIERIVGVFNGDEKALIRNQLSQSLQAVVCQRLLPSIEGKRVLCYEVMYATVGIRNLIREGKQHQIYSQMQNQSEVGMVTFNKCLYQLVRANKISIETAMEVTAYPQELQSMLSRSVAS